MWLSPVLIVLFRPTYDSFFTLKFSYLVINKNSDKKENQDHLAHNNLFVILIQKKNKLLKLRKLFRPKLISKINDSSNYQFMLFCAFFLFIECEIKKYIQYHVYELEKHGLSFG